MAGSNLVATITTKKRGRGAEEAKTSLDELRESVGKVQDVLGTAGAAFSAVQSAVQSVIDPFVELSGQVREMQRTIGATPEEASKLIQAADDVGVSADTLQSALEAAIKKGVKPTIAEMSKLADEYNDIQDPIERTKFLMDNFGKSGADLGPLMALGAAGIREAGQAAEDMGLVLDQQAIDAARRYEIAIDDWDDSLMGIKLTIAEKVLPAISGLIEIGTDMVQVSKAQVDALAAGNITMAESYGYTLQMITGQKSFEQATAELTRGVIGSVDAFDAEAARLQGLADYYNTTATPAVEFYTESLYYQTLGLDAMEAAQLLARDALAATTPEAYGLLTGTDLLKESMAGLTEQMIFNKAAANLDEEAALALGLSMGLVDTRVLVLNQSLANLKAKYDADASGSIDATEAANGYTAAVNALTASLLAVPNYTESTVRVMHITEYTEYYNDPNRPQGDRNAASGADFIVPPGYPNDSFRLNVQSGEHVQVTPAGQSSQSGGDTWNVTINAPGATASDLYEMLQSDDIRRRTGARR